MRIGSSLQPCMTARTRTQTAAQKSSSGRPACTTNSPLSGIRVQPDGEGVSSLSPYMRLCGSYERWKAQMTGRQDPLPDSKGLTEENLAYLKEHYSGELGWEERMDVLNTMKEMGILSGNQVTEACGGGMAAMSFGEMKTVTMSPLQQNNLWETRWDVLFQGDPIASFRTLDDILAWVDKVVDKTEKPQEAEGAAQEAAQEQEPVTTQELLEMRG